jgi:hypothetical protein
MNMSIKPVAVSSFVLFLAAISFGAGDRSTANPVLPDVTARGRALYEYDQAAWHATDAVKALNPPDQLVGRYIARKSDGRWTVGFGHLNAQRDAFLVAYEATQDEKPGEFKARKLDPPQEDKSFYLSAARAIEVMLHDFRGEARPYNVSVLPAPSDQLYLYMVPAQTKTDIFPMGGDARYLITADGNTIVEKRQLHKTILEFSFGSVPKGVKLQEGWHTHILSDAPEDTDVFYVLTRKPSLPENIGTSNKKMYRIDTDGTIHQIK